MSLAIYVVDAFTAKPFKGNPAAVCIVDAFPEDSDMQNIALEMNLSETVFLVKKAPLSYHIRWFTPVTEVNLCGHATLAATHILLETGQIKAGDIVTYESMSGELRAKALEKGVELDFPELPSMPASHKALDALGVSLQTVEKSRDNYIAEVADYKTLLACAPDFGQLLELDLQGVIVTTATGLPQGFDFASRYFAPSCGINEDPVTGSAHCTLASYWAKRLNKKTFKALQASQREGILGITLMNNRVLIAGDCVTTLKGELQFPPLQKKEKAA